MKFLRNLLDKVEPNFTGNGKYAKFYPLYEMADTFLFTPADKTKNGPHIRDAVDLKRVMSFVVIAMLPALLFGIFIPVINVSPTIAHCSLTEVPSLSQPFIYIIFPKY